MGYMMNKALLDSREKYDQQIAALELKTTQHINVISWDPFIFQAGDFYYEPPGPVANAFICSEAVNPLLIGPVGSGKTLAMHVKFLRQTLLLPTLFDGSKLGKYPYIRESAVQCIRSLDSWLQVMGNMGVVKSSRNTTFMYVNHIFNFEGVRIDFTIEYFNVLLEDRDKSKVNKGPDYTSAAVGEVSLQSGPWVIAGLQTRVGRKPQIGTHYAEGDYVAQVCGDSNKDGENSWLKLWWVDGDNPNIEVFDQPPGMLRVEDGEPIINPIAENITHLPKDYYPNIIRTATPEEAKVLVFNEWAPRRRGQLVFEHEFNYNIHTDDLDVLPDVPLILGWDFGYDPTCIIMQRVPYNHSTHPPGQIRVLEELISLKNKNYAHSTETRGIYWFVDNLLLPRLNTKYKGLSIISSWADPSGIARSQQNGTSSIGILNSEYDIRTDGAPSNMIPIRIQSMKRCLTRLIDGKGAIVFDRRGNSITIEGFTAGYIFEIVKNEGDELRPKKNHYSHPIDAVGYAVLGETYMSDKVADIKIKTFRPISRIM